MHGRVATDNDNVLVFCFFFQIEEVSNILATTEMKQENTTKHTRISNDM